MYPYFLCLDADILLEQWGRNELEEKRTPSWLVFVRQLYFPMPIMIWAAIACMAASPLVHVLHATLSSVGRVRFQAWGQRREGEGREGEWVYNCARLAERHGFLSPRVPD